MKTKSKIEKQVKRKTGSELVKTIIKAKKNDKWLEVAGLLSRSRKNKIGVNLDKIDENTEEGDTIVVPGKVLSKGKINKRIRIAALGFSGQARKKLMDNDCEVVSILEEIRVNPEARGIKIIK